MITDLRDIKPAVEGITDTLNALAGARETAERVAKSLVRLTGPRAPTSLLANAEIDAASEKLRKSLRTLVVAALAAIVIDKRDVEAVHSIMNHCVTVFGIGDPDVGRLSLAITATMGRKSPPPRMWPAY